MAVSYMTVLWCDFCDSPADGMAGGRDAKTVREQAAKAEGWKRRAGKDICQDCLNAAVA